MSDESARYEKVDAVRVWLTFREQDMTEGRLGLAQFGPAYVTEQAAWDAVNHLGGIMGRRPGRNCSPMGELNAAGADTWQKAKAVVGYPIDYDVRPVVVEGGSDQWDWPPHLRDDAPAGVCGRCGRETVAVDLFGQEDRMTQPDGYPCGGRFSDPRL